MDKREKMIGKHIREVRLEKKLSQEALADKCGFSNTTLSSYENNRKTPSLSTIAKIAKKLGVSIERLYYGDENNAFIISEPDGGKKIVNSVYFLWKSGVIYYFENYMSGIISAEFLQSDEDPRGIHGWPGNYRHSTDRSAQPTERRYGKACRTGIYQLEDAHHRI